MTRTYLCVFYIFLFRLCAMFVYFFLVKILLFQVNLYVCALKSCRPFVCSASMCLCDIRRYVAGGRCDVSAPCCGCLCLVLSVPGDGAA